MSRQKTDTDDPRHSGPQPPFPEQKQQPPGSEAAMDPRPDYGLDSYQGHQRLKGKAALITGGDSGIGRAVALAYAREGADVLISYLSEEQDAQETCRAVEASGGKIVAIAGDIGSPQHCRHLVDETVRAFGKLDILVNNAAYQMSYENLAKITPEEIEHTFRTNILAMFYLCQAAMPHMQPGASIINTASIQAYQPSSHLLPYATTKGAIVTFTKGLSEEAIEQGVRVNAVAPGPVWTPLIPSTMPAEHTAKFGQQTPVGRPAQPAELAPLFVFLASEESSYITGEVIGVTGGKPLS
jgi:NAD(P)-dependent dehydrogenase (short-subunit alcohol dehydrogenase family)